MKVNLVSALTGFIALGCLTCIAQAQDKYDYTKLISKDGDETIVEGADKIDVFKAHQLHEEGILFVDVNSPRSYKFAHIPGAINLDFKAGLTAESLAEHAAQDQTIVFYCPHIGCYGAATASAKAITWGYANVMIFEGGADVWSEAGYPIEGDKTTLSKPSN